MFSKASISQVLLSRLELHDGAGTGGGISEESKRAMTPTAWRPYPDRVRSSHWYELFADTQGDERSRLTWKGLFRDIDNTVNSGQSVRPLVRALARHPSRVFRRRGEPSAEVGSASGAQERCLRRSAAHWAAEILV